MRGDIGSDQAACDRQPRTLRFPALPARMSTKASALLGVGSGDRDKNWLRQSSRFELRGVLKQATAIVLA